MSRREKKVYMPPRKMRIKYRRKIVGLRRFNFKEVSNALVFVD
jgi:hypothetical protein